MIYSFKALTGFTREITTLDDRKLAVTMDAGDTVQSGQLKGKVHFEKLFRLFTGQKYDLK